MRPSSLAFRLVASAALWCAVALSAGGFMLSAVFGDMVQRNFDARLNVLLEGLIAGSEVGANGALLLRLQLGEPRFEQPLSGWYWQIEPQGGGPRMRSDSLWDSELRLAPPPEGEVGRQDVTGPDGQILRLAVRAISLPGSEQPFLYGVAGDRTEISEQKQRFDRLLALALGGLFLGLLLAILLQVRFGLEPLRRLHRALAAIRSGRARHLEGSFPNEIRPLANELNALLGHSETLIERARTHVGNLAHGLKTPLAVLTNEAERSDGPLADLIERQVGLMRHQVDHHLVRARMAATGGVLGARTEIAPVISDLVRALSRIHGRRGIAIDSRCPPSLAFRGARQDLEELLGNLLDNACKWAQRQVSIEVAPADGGVLITVDDDGPGLPPERREEVLQRGRRLDERMPGSGLGLAIVADVAALYGGAIELDRAPRGGLRARLTLPAAPTE